MKQGIIDYIKNRFMNSSIKNKMIIINCIIILLVASSIGTSAYILYKQTITNRLATVNQRDLVQIGSSIDYIQKDITEMSSFIGSDSIVQKTICYTPEELSLNFKDQNYVKYLLNNLLVSKDYVSFIGIYAENGFSHYAASDISSNIPDFKTIKETPLYQKANEKKGAPLWSYITKDDTDYIRNNKNNKMSMFRTLLKLNDYSTKAFMMISVNMSDIRDIYESVLEVKDSTIIFLDEGNQPFFYDTNIAQGVDIQVILRDIPEKAYQMVEGTEIYPYDGKSYLLTYTTLKNVKWKIFNVVPLSSYAININYVPVIVICIFVVALLFGFYFTNFASTILTKPIKNLLESMIRVRKGNFKETVGFKFDDEIGRLGAVYDEMIAHINNLVNQVYVLGIEEKIAELKALEAQINPHFLYNTLDTIYWKAVAGDNKGVQEMIHALSKVFRLALNVGKEFFSISQEKEFIGYYILLQEKRYKNKLQYSINFSSDILFHQIPKLILQPFVENAIVHGIETDDKQTAVTISGFMDKGRIHFIIKDDGAGMPQAVLDTLLDPVADKNTAGGYGIKNVINRLSIYYGQDYCLNVQSELGKGTEIDLILPTSPCLSFEKGHGDRECIS